MEEKFRVKKSAIGSRVETMGGERIEMVFPPNTKYEFDNNTVIADVSKTNKRCNYKVFSYLEGRIVSCFDCNYVKKLDNGNYKLTLRKDYEGQERSLIFDPVVGKAASDIYDEMSEVNVDGTLLCTINVNKRGCSFKYLLKIDPTGKVVSDALNAYTEEVVPYDELVNDENKTINLITEKARKNFVKGYELIKK